MQLTKKQKSAFKKICSVHGPKFVRNTLENGKKEHRDFVLQLARLQGVWSRPNYLELADSVDPNFINVSLQTLVASFFDISADWYERTRGDNQKLTYRTNRLNNAFSDWSNRNLFTSHTVGESLLFSFNIANLSNLLDYRNSRWFVPAKSMDEAVAVFEAMVLIPLGYSEPPRSQRSNWDVRCHGLSKWFNYESINSKVTGIVMDNFYTKKAELKQKLQQLETSKKETDMKLAILNQFRMFVSDDT